MIARCFTAFLLLVALPLLPQISASGALHAQKQSCCCRDMKVSCCSSQQPVPTGTTTPASQSKSLEVKPVAAMQEIAVFQGRSVSAEPVTLQSRMGMLPHVSPPLARSGILLI